MKKLLRATLFVITALLVSGLANAATNGTKTPPSMSTNETKTPPLMSTNGTKTPPLMSTNGTKTPPLLI
jgi:hypothetical protein